MKHNLETLHAATKPAPRQMQSSDYLETLATVDTANLEEFQSFVNATLFQPYENQPDLIPIGSHDGVQYFIESSDLEITQDWSTPRGRQLDKEGLAEALGMGPAGQPLSPFPSIDQGSIEDDVRLSPPFPGNSAGTPQGSTSSSTGIPLRSVASSAGTHSPDDFDRTQMRKGSPKADNELYSGMSFFSIQNHRSTTTLRDMNYGFGIGRLNHQMPNSSRPEDTGFYVICNALDKSIWIAFDFEPYGETGEISIVRPEYGHPYGRLPGDRQNLVIGVQRLFDKDWTTKRPFSLERGDPFMNSDWRPMPTRLIAEPVSLGEVVKAIEEYRGRLIGSSSGAQQQAAGRSQLSGKGADL